MSIIYLAPCDWQALEVARFPKKKLTSARDCGKLAPLPPLQIEVQKMTNRPWLQFFGEGVPCTLTYPDQSVPQFLIDTAARNPDAIATTLYDVDLTYGEINAKTNALSHALKDRGIRKGDRVALLLPNSPTYVISYYGVLKAGAIVVNINVMTHGEELSGILSHTNARLVITLDIFVGNVLKIVDRTPVAHIIIHSVFGKEKELALKSGIKPPMLMDDFVAAQRTDEPETVSAGSDIAVLQLTGGTTGTPKAAMLTHRNIVANVLQISCWNPKTYRPNAAVICIIPFFHVFGMMSCLNLPVHKGYRLVLIPMFDWSYILDMLEMVKKYRPISFPAVPALWAAMVSHPKAAEFGLKDIEVAVTGGAPLALWIQEKFEALTGRSLTAAYGLTEASSTTHLTPFHLRGKPGSIGVPLPDTDARIADIESGDSDCPPGEIGELVVKGPQVMAGYWQQAELTAGTVRDGWLYTGDLAKMDAEGFFYIVDRKDDMIISSGFNVYPSEIEELIARHPDVKEAAVIGKPDRTRGESILAFVVAEENRVSDKAALLAFCRENLAAYKVPKSIIFVDTIPKSPVGKPLRRVLRDGFRSSV
jgi:long-chain acyl-CoA synthetase